MAEWLGRGLQNLVQRFDSASHLTNAIPCSTRTGDFFIRSCPDMKKAMPPHRPFSIRAFRPTAAYGTGS